MERKRILFIGNSHLTVFGFRKEIIEAFVQDGHDVTVSFPNGPFGEGETTAIEHGCKFIETSIDRRGTNPLKDLALFFAYIKLIHTVKPDIVFAFTVKPDVYGGIVCRMLGVPYVLNITGLGKGLAEGGVTQKITAMLYRLAARKAQCVFFQNFHDKEFFNNCRIVYKKGVLLPGSGVNLKQFEPMAYPVENTIRFIYVARLMKAKGIEEYLAAAKAVKEKYPDTEFHVCGFCEEAYREEIERRAVNGEIFYHGLVKDVRAYEKDIHCVVLPSFHPEGISNVLLEAAASARPIITTDHPGCRDAVDDGVNGFLVEKQNAADLAQKMERFILLPHEEKEKMGQEGRHKVAKEFNRQIVVDAYRCELNAVGVEL